MAVQASRNYFRHCASGSGCTDRHDVNEYETTLPPAQRVIHNQNAQTLRSSLRGAE